MSKVAFDLAIIGTGGAAFSAAIRAHELGADRIALIEQGTLGGTCVNVGCVPSKTLLAAARVTDVSRHHSFVGVPHADGLVDLAALVGQKDELVAEMRQGKYLDLANLYGFDLIEGQARFHSTDEVLVGDRSIRADRFIVATGAEPALPTIDGLNDVPVLTSASAMELTELPEQLLVIGGGFVGLEQAQMFRRLGAEVTLVGRIAPHAEPELAGMLADALRAGGIDVHAGRATRVRTQANQIIVETGHGARLAGSHLLVATGRRPRTTELDLPAAGIDVDDRGRIITDPQQRTTNSIVYAAGDVTAAHQFVYLAAAQGAIAAENAITDQGSTVDLAGLPQVIFTDPQLASAGLTEAQAHVQGWDTDSRVLPLDKVPRAVVEHDTRGAIKIVADKHTHRVLGIHALAANAGDLMLAATYAIRSQMTVEDIALTWAPYLTYAEGIRLTARSFDHDVERLSCCA